MDNVFKPFYHLIIIGSIFSAGTYANGETKKVVYNQSYARGPFALVGFSVTPSTDIKGDFTIAWKDVLTWESVSVRRRNQASIDNSDIFTVFRGTLKKGHTYRKTKKVPLAHSGKCLAFPCIRKYKPHDKDRYFEGDVLAALAKFGIVRGEVYDTGKFELRLYNREVILPLILSNQEEEEVFEANVQNVIRKVKWMQDDSKPRLMAALDTVEENFSFFANAAQSAKRANWNIIKFIDFLTVAKKCLQNRGSWEKEMKIKMQAVCSTAIFFTLESIGDHPELSDIQNVADLRKHSYYFNILDTSSGPMNAHDDIIAIGDVKALKIDAKYSDLVVDD